MRAPFAILEFLIGLILPSSHPHFIWRTESITAEVRRDDEYLRLGQYLHLEQQLRDGEQGWTMMKVNLPERWTIEEVSVGDGKVRLRTKGGSSYALTNENVVKLDSEILNAETRSDDVLEKIWNKHALEPAR